MSTLESEFWYSPDGQILSLNGVDNNRFRITLGFKLRSRAEFEFVRDRADDILFSERSSLARIGIEVEGLGPPRAERRRIVMEAYAFAFDRNFPTAAWMPKLLRPGIPIGRLFFAPESRKLTADRIWRAVRENRVKLPETISVDRLGRVFLTPHKVRYTLNPKITLLQVQRLVRGSQDRAFLDKVQIREDLEVLSIPPRSGILTSCSMYLKEHYVVLNRGEGNFGLHCGAVLLDPIKTFGTNVMLEIYNTSDQPVVNPVVSVELFRAPRPRDSEFRSKESRRRAFYNLSGRVYRKLAAGVQPDTRRARPRIKVSLKGQSGSMENRSALVNFADRKALSAALKDPVGCRTLIQALEQGPEDADTLVTDYFPNLVEHIELLSRIPKLGLKRIIFRQPSRTHGFFFSTNAHARLDTHHAIGLDVHWHNEALKDLHTHVYRKEQGFFVREELVDRFMESTILAIYGSATAVDSAEGDKIQRLIQKMTDFLGPGVGILTGGGGGVMRLAADLARSKDCLTGACFLELEAQPPEMGVEFFNTFQETARHNRQKWFEVADFCVFNVGGMGTLEEIGIEMCNLKLGIRPRVPYVFYNATYWKYLRDQIHEMIRSKRAPAWIADHVLFTDDPDEVVAFYRKTLRVI